MQDKWTLTDLLAFIDTMPFDTFMTHVEKGADLWVRDEKGNTLLHRAVVATVDPLYKTNVLLERVPGLLHARNGVLETPLHTLLSFVNLQAASSKTLMAFHRILSLLLSCGASTETTNAKGVRVMTLLRQLGLLHDEQLPTVVPLDSPQQQLSLRKGIQGLLEEESTDPFITLVRQLRQCEESLSSGDQERLARVGALLIPKEWFFQPMAKSGTLKSKSKTSMKLPKALQALNETLGEVSQYFSQARYLPELTRAQILNGLQALQDYYAELPEIHPVENQGLKNHFFLSGVGLNLQLLSYGAALFFDRYFEQNAQLLPISLPSTKTAFSNHAINDVYYRLKKTGIEADEAVRQLSHIFFSGQAFPAAELVFLHKVSQEEKAIQRKYLPLFAAKLPQALPLAQCLTERPQGLTMTFSSYHYSLHFILACLTQPAESLPEHFMVVDSKAKIAESALLGIDTQGVFSPLIQKKEDKTHRIGVKAVIFCLSQMNEPLDLVARKEFLAQEPALIVLQWLKGISAFRAACAEEAVKLWGADKLLSLAPFCSSRMAMSLYHAINRLQTLLEANPTLTHDAILLAFEPLLGLYYQKIRTLAQGDWGAAKLRLAKDESLETLSERHPDIRSVWEKRLLKEGVEKEADDLQVYDMDRIAESLVSEIDFGVLDPAVQRRCLEEIAHHFSGIRRLSLKGCTVLDESLCALFSEQLKELLVLSLDGCAGIRETALERLLVRFPALELRLSNMPSLSPADILSLEQHTQNLSVSFATKTYILKSTKLASVAEQAIRQSCFREAIASGNIEWTLFFFQSGTHIGEGGFSPLHEAIKRYQLPLVKHLLKWGVEADGIWDQMMPLDTAYQSYEAANSPEQKETALRILAELLQAGAMQCEKRHALSILSVLLKSTVALTLKSQLWQFGLNRGCLKSEQVNDLLACETETRLSLDWQKLGTFGNYSLTPWITDFFSALQKRQLKLRSLAITGCEGFDQKALATAFRLGLEKLTLDVTQANALGLLTKPLPQLELTLSSLELRGKNKETDFPALLRVLSQPGYRLETLRLLNVELRFEEWSNLCSALAKYRHLKCLQLRDVKCDSHLKLLLNALKQNALETVILERVVHLMPQDLNPQQSMAYCQQLAHFIQEQPKLVKFSIDRNPMGDAGLEVLFSAIGKHAALQEVYLNEVEMTEVGLESLRVGLLANKALCKLDIRFNRLSEAKLLSLIGLVQFHGGIQNVLYEEQYDTEGKGQSTVKLAKNLKILAALRRNRIHYLSQQRFAVWESALLTEKPERGLMQGVKQRTPLRPCVSLQRSVSRWAQVKTPSSLRQQLLLDHISLKTILKERAGYQDALLGREATLKLQARWEQKEKRCVEEGIVELKRVTDPEPHEQRVLKSLEQAQSLYAIRLQDRMALLSRLKLKQAAIRAFVQFPLFQSQYQQMLLSKSSLIRADFDFGQSLTLECLGASALKAQVDDFIERFLDFLQQGVDLKLRDQLLEIADPSGRTLLMWAAENGRLEPVSFLLEQGVAVNCVDESKRNAFLWACLGGNLSVMRQLCEKGADILQSDEAGRNAISYAAQGGHLPAIEWLLTVNEAFSLQTQSALLETPLLRAAAGGQVALFASLMAKQGGVLTDVDQSGRDLLLMGAESDQPATVEWALAQGLSLDKKDRQDRTARELLNDAEGHPVLYAWWQLREALNTPAADAIVLAATRACLAIKGKRGSALCELILRQLVASGRLEILTEIDSALPLTVWSQVDEKGNTLLHVAAQSDQAPIAEWLLKKGLGEKEKNHAGQTAYQMAREKGAVGVSGVLLGLKAPVINESALQFHTDTQGEKKRLGIGAFSQVYHGRWQHSEIAYKEMTITVSFDSSAFVEFTSEVNLLAKSQHPHVVRLYGVTLSPLGLVMEWVSQGSLRAVLEAMKSGKMTPFTWGQRATIGEDMAKGLAFLHSPNIQICHRDLKSDNVLLDDQLRAKLTDFGLAEVKSLAGPKQAAGSVPWLAPESLGENPVQTAASDLYSYGVTLWELATQQIPYEGLPVPVICERVLAKNQLPLPENFPEAWSALLKKCWQFTAPERPTATTVIRYFDDHHHELAGEVQRENPSVLHFKGEDRDKRDQRQVGTAYTNKTLRYLFPMLENPGRVLLYVMGEEQALEKVLNYLALLSVTFAKPAVFILPTKEAVYAGLLFGTRLIWIDVQGQPPASMYGPIFKKLKTTEVITDIFFSDTHFFASDESVIAGQHATVWVELFRAMLTLPLQQWFAFAEELPHASAEGGAIPVSLNRLLPPALKVLQTATKVSTLDPLALFRQQHLMLLESQPREAVLRGQYPTEAEYIDQCYNSACQTFMPQLSSVFEKNQASFKKFVQWLRLYVTQPGNKPFNVALQKLAQGLVVADNPTASMPLIPAATLTSVQRIGSGAFGEVYRGYWQQTLVAIKKLRGAQLSPPIIKEFRNEAALLSSIHHPNVLGCYGICTDMSESPLSMILEFLPGGSLDRHLRTPDNIPKSVLPDWSIRQRIALDIAKGLACLHARGIIHGDLRACNILLDEQYQAKIGDFGLAKQRIANLSVVMTNERTSGYYNWLSPELRQTNKRTFASDIYSFGFILWELMTGKAPYHEAFILNNVRLLESLMASGQTLALHTPPPDAPEVLVTLMRQCLADDPAARPTIQVAVETLFQAVYPEEYATYRQLRYPDSALNASSTGADVVGLMEEEETKRGPGHTYAPLSGSTEESRTSSSTEASIVSPTDTQTSPNPSDEDEGKSDSESSGVSDTDSESEGAPEEKAEVVKPEETGENLLRAGGLDRHSSSTYTPVLTEPRFSSSPSRLREKSQARRQLSRVESGTTSADQKGSSGYALPMAGMKREETQTRLSTDSLKTTVSIKQPVRPAAPPPRWGVFASAPSPQRPLPPSTTNSISTTNSTSDTGKTTASSGTGYYYPGLKQ